MELFEMMEQRAKVTNSIREVMNAYESKEMPADKKEEMARLEKEFDNIDAKIVAEEKQKKRERTLGEIKTDEAKAANKTDLFAKALGGRPEDVSAYKSAIKNTFQLSDDEQAGYLTAPVVFGGEVIRGLDNLNHMRQVARVITGIGPGQSLGYPFRKTEASDADWTGEIAAAGEETTLDFGRREFKPHRLAKRIKLSETLMRHAPLAESALQREIIYKINAAQENAYLNGNGTAQPLGVFQASNDGISTNRDVDTDNTATAVTFDGLMNAKYSVKQQYHANAKWIAHRDFAKQIAKIKDGEGQYIWQPSVQAGTPDRLLGGELHLSEYAPNTFTTGLYVAVYGDFNSGYWICDAEAIRIKILNELYAENNQIGYIVNYFGDGMPVIEEAFARVKLG